MTTMQSAETGTGADSSDELVQELTALRATHAQLREELVEVRRQRDEAIGQAQWLILRVNNAEQALERLQAELAADESVAAPLVAPSVEPLPMVAPLAVVPASRVTPDEPAEVAAVDEAETAMDVPKVAALPQVVPVPVVPEPAVVPAVPVVPTLAVGPQDHVIEVEPVPDAAVEPETDVAVETVAEVPSQQTRVEEVTPMVLAPGAWANRSGPWLPPSEGAVDDGSMAHEFAALTERAIAVEAAEAAEAEEAAAMVPAPVEMNVLPEGSAGSKRGSLFRRR